MEKKEYSIEFIIPRFLKFFVDHLIFFSLGPLVNPIVAAIDSIGLAYNMFFAFKSTIKGSMIFQYTFFLYNLFLIVIWSKRYLNPGKGWLKGIYQDQVWFYALHTVIRCFIIAVRYEYFSDLRHSMYFEGAQSPAFVGKVLLREGWLMFHPTCGLWEEIKSAMYRNQVKDKLFTFSFVKNYRSSHTLTTE